MATLIPAELLHTIEATLASSDGLGPRVATLLASHPEPPETAAIERARQTVERVGTEVWATTDAYDFEDCLADLVERRPWPSVEPLLQELWLRLPPDEQGLAVWSHVTRRALVVFGPAHLVRFMEAVTATQDASRAADHFSRKVPVEVRRAAEIERVLAGQRGRDAMFLPGFPPALRRALLAGLRSSLCGVAVVDALLNEERHPDEKIERVLRTWHEGAALYAKVMAAFVKDPALTLHFVKEGISLPSVETMVDEGQRLDALLEEAMDQGIQALDLP